MVVMVTPDVPTLTTHVVNSYRLSHTDQLVSVGVASDSVHLHGVVGGGMAERQGPG